MCVFCIALLYYYISRFLTKLYKSHNNYNKLSMIGTASDEMRAIPLVPVGSTVPCGVGLHAAHWVRVHLVMMLEMV